MKNGIHTTFPPIIRLYKIKTISCICLLNAMSFMLFVHGWSYEKPEFFVQLGHFGDINSVTFSPDGKFVLTGSSDTTTKLWDISTGQEIRTFSGHSRGVNSVAFSQDGKFVLTGSEDGYAKVLQKPPVVKQIKATKEFI